MVDNLKVLNTEKNDLSKMMNNKEIKDMMVAFGCGMGKDFNIKNLRYDKIIMMCDSDVDGSHIRTLLLTFIFNYMRPLIEEGHVYAAMPPLYKVVKNKENIYLLDDAELMEYKKAHSSENITVNYFKGLGEMSSEQLEETTMSRANRRMKKITMKDAEKAQRVFNKLMGSAVSPRREFIEQNAYRANVDI